MRPARRLNTYTVIFMVTTVHQ